ncbi:alpha/beta hydrolase [Tardiphaga sp. P9-11]|uniref:alpha/beta fold hydrolase n=1 Tax=Tardiphaga sp. P9-11 TaxID=2024614 RepID=UPI0011F16FD8|nr:alpha/beta hydrolase [Tardiphaga sp. P9-11]KAA0070026.1 alpha/beta hydrolase [Tardiphaga sp. P9-11]
MKQDTHTPAGNTSRRKILLAAGGAAVAVSIPKTSLAAKSARAAPSRTVGSTISAKDGAKLFYKDWGNGRPVIFSHGWPLTSDAWDSQMLFLSSNGYRVIAHDRRGHGRSDQPSGGNDMNTYADDLAAVIESLDLDGVTLVGHSAGGGEVARYVGRHGVGRVSKIVLISSVPPRMLKAADNPEAAPIEAFDGLRAGLSADRSSFFKGLAMPFFGFNRPNAKVQQGMIDAFWAQGMQGSIRAQFECIKAFSETDFTADLKKMSVPTLIVHGDDDQIVPIGISSTKSAKLAPKVTFKVYQGAPHGLCVTMADRLNADLLAFLKG